MLKHVQVEMQEVTPDEPQVHVQSPSSTSSALSARPVTAPAPSPPSRPSSVVRSRPSTARGEIRTSRQSQSPRMNQYPPFAVGIEEVIPFYILIKRFKFILFTHFRYTKTF